LLPNDLVLIERRSLANWRRELHEARETIAALLAVNQKEVNERRMSQQAQQALQQEIEDRYKPFALSPIKRKYSSWFMFIDMKCFRPHGCSWKRNTSSSSFP
jgi:hypothetical protein